MSRQLSILSSLFFCDFKLSKFVFFALALSPLVVKSSTSLPTRRQLVSLNSSEVSSYLELNNAGNNRLRINHPSKERSEICVKDLMADRSKQHPASERFINHSDESMTNVRNWSQVSISKGVWSDLVELEKRELIILFAQQEARCLEDFGELRPAPKTDLLGQFLRPVVCLVGSVKYKACEQCHSIIRRGLNSTTNSQCISCKNICHDLSALADCADRCSKLLGNVVNGRESARKGSDAGINKCNGESCKNATLNAGTDATGGKRKQWNTLTTHVFCEGVTNSSSKNQTTSLQTRAGPNADAVSASE